MAGLQKDGLIIRVLNQSPAANSIEPDHIILYGRDDGSVRAALSDGTEIRLDNKDLETIVAMISSSGSYDANAVHKTGAEFISGAKTFEDTLTVSTPNAGPWAVVLRREDSGSNFDVKLFNDNGRFYIASNGLIAISGSSTIFRADSSALAYMSNTIWHTGNDGAGSGLDADTLDGLQSTAFASQTNLESLQTFNTQVAGVTASHGTRLTTAETQNTAQTNSINSLQIFNSQVAGVTASQGATNTAQTNSINSLQTFNTQLVNISAAQNNLLNAHQLFNTQVAGVTASHGTRLTTAETQNTAQTNSINVLQTFNTQVAGVTGSHGARLNSLETQNTGQENSLAAHQVFNTQLTGVTGSFNNTFNTLQNFNTRVANVTASHGATLTTLQTFNTQVAGVTASQGSAISSLQTTSTSQLGRINSADSAIAAHQAFNSQTASTSAFGNFRGSNATYWSGTVYSTTANPISSQNAEGWVNITNLYPGGYDVGFAGWQTTSLSEPKPTFVIGAVGARAWTGGSVSTQASDFYILLRNDTNSMVERLRITHAGDTSIKGRLFVNESAVTISGTTNPYLAFNDGTGAGYVQVVNGDINLFPRSGKVVTVSSVLTVNGDTINLNGRAVLYSTSTQTNVYAGSSALYITSSNGGTIYASVTSGAMTLEGITLDMTNNVPLRWKDNFGTQRRLALMTSTPDIMLGAIDAGWEAKATQIRAGRNIDLLTGGSSGAFIIAATASISGHFLPGATDSRDLGDSSTRWRDVYSGRIFLTGGGAGSVSNSPITMENNRIVVWEDSGGTLTNCGFVWYNSSNQLILGTGNSSRVVLTNTILHPNTDNAVDFGSSTNRWKSLYAHDSVLIINANSSPSDTPLFSATRTNNISAPTISGAAYYANQHSANWFLNFRQSDTNTSVVKINGAGTLALRGGNNIGALTVATASETSPQNASTWDSTKHVLLAGPGATTTSAALAASLNQSTGEASLYALTPGVSWNVFGLYGTEIRLQNYSTSTPVRLLLQNGGAGQSRFVEFKDNTNTKYNWALGTQINVDNGFEIIPSSAAGGSTYSTAVFIGYNNGDAAIGGATIPTTGTSGYVYLPLVVGTPTGVPTVRTGRLPIVIDSSNYKLYAYTDSAWRNLSGTALANFAESRNTSAPNATLPVHQLIASGSETNIDFSLSPKGTGALTWQIPDSTTTGGNKRGTNAIDLQTSRILADQVASGARSAIIGGTNNRVAGIQAAIIGGSANYVDSGATYGMILGGSDNQIINGTRSVILGGQNNYSNQGNAIVFGKYAESYYDSSIVHGYEDSNGWLGGSAPARNKIARHIIPISVRTTDATVTPIRNPSGEFIIQANRVYGISAWIVAEQEGVTHNCAYYCLEGCVRLDSAGGTPTIVGTTVVRAQENNAAWNVTLTVLSPEQIYINAVGAAATNIRWAGYVQIIELARSS